MYVQSNCDVPSDRDRYVSRLMQHMQVSRVSNLLEALGIKLMSIYQIDSYGLCLHNKDFNEYGLEGMENLHDSDFLDLLGWIAFEFLMHWSNISLSQPSTNFTLHLKMPYVMTISQRSCIDLFMLDLYPYIWVLLTWTNGVRASQLSKVLYSRPTILSTSFPHTCLSLSSPLFDFEVILHHRLDI